MNRRVAAAVVAAVLALAAFISIFFYVRSADVRALSGVAVRSVYTVVNPIAKGTASSALGESVQRTDLPAKTVPADAVSDLNQIVNKVASTDLVAGEVLLSTRFTDPATVSLQEVAVPKGMSQVSILVKPEQVNGGVVKAGDTIGIILVFKSATAPAYTVPGVGAQPGDGEAVTKQIFNKILVTRVTGAAVIGTDGKTASAADGSIMLTLALEVSDIEKLAWAQATGTLLMTLENKDSDDSKSHYTTGSVVLK